jgi:succinyl-diaminopimelate desuccinylase
MKSGLAVMLGLVEAPCPTTCPLTLIFYAGEEGPFAGNELGRVFLELPQLSSTDVALALEPTDNELQLGCGGSIQAHVTFAGKSAHSSRPWQGENAIYNSLEFLQRLKQCSPIPREVEGLTWMTSMSATLIDGGRAPNVIPDKVVVNVNARFAPNQTTEDVEENLRALAGPTAVVTLVDVSPPAPPHRNHPLLQVLKDCGVAAVHPKFAWTDVARFAQLKVPAANFGPGCLAQAHQRNEWTSIAALHHGDALLRRWLTRIGTSGSD